MGGSGTPAGMVAVLTGPAVAHSRHTQPTHSPGWLGELLTQSLSHLVPTRPWGPAQGRWWRLGLLWAPLSVRAGTHQRRVPEGAAATAPPSPAASPGLRSCRWAAPNCPFPSAGGAGGGGGRGCAGKAARARVIPKASPGAGGDPGPCQPRTPGSGHRQPGGAGHHVLLFSRPWGHRFLPPGKTPQLFGVPCQPGGPALMAPGSPSPAQPRGPLGPSITGSLSVHPRAAVCLSIPLRPSSPALWALCASQLLRPLPPRPGPRIPQQTPRRPRSYLAAGGTHPARLSQAQPSLAQPRSVRLGSAQPSPAWLCSARPRGRAGGRARLSAPSGPALRPPEPTPAPHRLSLHPDHRAPSPSSCPGPAAPGCAPNPRNSLGADPPGRHPEPPGPRAPRKRQHPGVGQAAASPGLTWPRSAVRTGWR